MNETINKQLQYIYDKMRVNDIVALELQPSARYTDAQDVSMLMVDKNLPKDTKPEDAPIFILTFEGVRDIVIGSSKNDLPKIEPVDQMTLPIMGQKGVC